MLEEKEQILVLVILKELKQEVLIGGGTGAVSYYDDEDGDSGYSWGGSGGGGTDIRIGQDSLYARVIVAGGGSGGAKSNNYSTGVNGYVGGGITSGGYNSTYWATQTKPGSGGSFGQGGNAGGSYVYISGAGGGGWYGGGRNMSDSSNIIARSGGGSGYVYTSSTASSYPSGCLLNSSYYLASTTIVDGATSFTSPTGSTETGHSGNGYARITYEKTNGYQTIGNTTVNFEYTGYATTFVVPETGDYTLEVWGAQGGTGYSSVGGKGGYSRGVVHLEEYQVLYIYVGGKGTDTGTTYSQGTKAGGFNRRRNW